MSLRTGFIARSFMSLGSLTASFGYGGIATALITTTIPGPLSVNLQAAPPEGAAAQPVKPRIVTGQKKPRG